MYPDGAGLYQQVTQAGVASWTLRYMLSGVPRYMGLGPCSEVSLADAREKARKARDELREGIDPIEARKARKAARRLADAAAVTFKTCAEQFIESNKSGWRNPKHAEQWTSTLATYAYPIIGNLPVQSIDNGLMIKVLKPIWDTKTETASRVRGRIEQILDYATVHHWRQGDNPARWKGNLDKVFKPRAKVQKVEHHAALAYAEVGAFMERLRSEEGIAAKALEFTILTAGRTNEIIGARWDEFDLGARLWTVPGKRMKAEKPHRVALSEAAIAILEKMKECREGDYVFPGGKAGRPLSNMAMAMLMKRMDRSETVHGFRSTFRDWCAEQTNFPREVAEMALAHTVSDQVEAAYRRGDLFAKRRQLAEAWSRHCAAVKSLAKSGDNVTTIRASA
jgi:integrase